MSTHRLSVSPLLALAATFLVACSGSSNGTPSGQGTVTDGGLTLPPGCVTNALEIYFTPMYSAYDGVHTFQIPAVVNGVDQSTITWSASNSSMVSIATDPVTGGAMITVNGSGTTSIGASIGGTVCGASLLTITDATPDEWDAGYQRYHDGVTLQTDAGTGHGFNFNPQAACINCHNADSTPTPGSPFTAIAHTPEQAGGFSDSDLMGIFLDGNVPDGGYFDSTIVPQQVWHQFHQWQMTPEEEIGIVVYLRSLTPTPQSGSANFGGHGGGFYDGGHGDYDGGGFPGGPGGPGGGGADGG